MAAAEQGGGLRVAARAKRISNHRNRIEALRPSSLAGHPLLQGFTVIGEWSE